MEETKSQKNGYSQEKVCSFETKFLRLKKQIQFNLMLCLSPVRVDV